MGTGIQRSMSKRVRPVTLIVHTNYGIGILGREKYIWYKYKTYIYKVFIKIMYTSIVGTREFSKRSEFVKHLTAALQHTTCVVGRLVKHTRTDSIPEASSRPFIIY